jgi:hypothetical protein
VSFGIILEKFRHVLRTTKYQIVLSRNSLVLRQNTSDIFVARQITNKFSHGQSFAATNTFRDNAVVKSDRATEQSK